MRALKMGFPVAELVVLREVLGIFFTQSRIWSTAPGGQVLGERRPGGCTRGSSAGR